MRHGRSPTDEIRLAEHNKAVLDYLLLPTTGTITRLIRFTEPARVRRGIERFETAAALVRAVSRRVTKPSRASPTKPARQKKLSTSSRSKRMVDHARH
jgi:hypothetical protein